jgi:hypothetical protein
MGEMGKEGGAAGAYCNTVTLTSSPDGGGLIRMGIRHREWRGENGNQEARLSGGASGYGRHAAGADRHIWRFRLHPSPCWR